MHTHSPQSVVNPVDCATPSLRKPTHVYLFATCLVDLFVPQAGLDAVRLLEREGLTVVFQEQQTCCGQPAYSSGQPEQARAVAARQLDLFPEDWPIVVPSGSCAGMFRDHYPKLFANDPVRLPLAQSIAARVWELNEFLVNVMEFSWPDQGDACEVALHTSCSARRETAALESSRELLGGLSQVTLLIQDHESECCGFGGMFTVRHPEISGAMVSDKLKAIQACGAKRLVTGDCGCMLNILGHAQKTGQDLPGEHLASFLWRRTAASEGESA